MTLFWLVLLFIGILGAWYLGYQMRFDDETAKKVTLPHDYLVGLNYLLNEEPDKAVDIFIKMLEVDSDTVETHLAVGKLFRRRGEVDRAIRIHQNLIARPHLEKRYRDQSVFELAQDYFSAGMLDRAERIYLEIVDVKEYAVRALNALLNIYQQEKAWHEAIATAKKLQKATDKNMQHIIAHYYCELSEAATKKNDSKHAKEYLEKALEADQHCARASLLFAKLEMADKNYKIALKYLKQIKAQNPDYLSESIDLLASCYEALKEEKKLVPYLMELLDEYPKLPVVLILSERIRQWKGDKVAANFVADYVRRYPSVRGLSLFINLYLSNAEGRAREDLLILQGLMNKLLANKPEYQCGTCGFEGKTLHWHCPGCKQWSSLKPIHCVES